MSDTILTALMHLFAIIASPEKKDGENGDRRSIVKTFLKNQMNEDLVEQYLMLFDGYYEAHQVKQKEVKTNKRVIAAASVKVLKICTEINDELTKEQKIIVVFQLLEFIRYNDSFTEQELEFVQTVAELFYVNMDEYNEIRDFAISNSEIVPATKNLLIINSDKDFSMLNVRHMYREQFNGTLWVLYVQSASIFLIKYFGRSEVYLNRQLITSNRIHVLLHGTSIRYGSQPIYLSDITSCFNKDRIESHITFEAKEIYHRFPDGTQGLYDISFNEESGHLVGIMGSSGSGKSTLLHALNGSVKPTKGNVYINGIDIYNNKEKTEGLIGYVAQDDLLIEELTVFQNLYYNARLCFSGYSEEQLVETVNKTLTNLGLFSIKDIQVGTPLNKKISGGQRKRLNIGLELIREPAILFLDEPTSGLSSRDSENIIDLLKELTFKRKLVFVVIHQPSSDIFKTIDRLIILDTGGYLIYNGDPVESITYFKEQIHHADWEESECRSCGNVNPEQIFNIIETDVLDEYGNTIHARKILPKEWARRFKNHVDTKKQLFTHATELPKITFKIPSKWNQFRVFLLRDTLSKLSNTQYILINLLEAPVLAYILSFIVKYYNISATNLKGYIFSENCNLPVYIFIAVIVAVFMGMTVSAEEIIKDRKILKREAFLNLSWGSYLMSKSVRLFIVSAIQALTFVIIGNSILEIKGMYFKYWLVLFSCWASCNILGLIISDSFKTVITIYILIPFLVIPQIILSGVLVQFEKLNPSISTPKNIPFYGEMITARWGYEALAVNQFMNNKYQKEFYSYDKEMSKADYIKNYWVPDLENKLEFIRGNINDSISKNNITDKLNVIKNEIQYRNIKNSQELQNIKNSGNLKTIFFNTKRINPQTFNRDIFIDIKLYLDKMRRYNIKKFKLYNTSKNNKIKAMEHAMGKENYLNLKESYYNEKLTELVEDKNETVRIVEYKGHLYQKTDPIYLDPENYFLKSHFYAPRKRIFGQFYDTYWINVIVIWLTTIFLYLVLHFRILKRSLDVTETLFYKYMRRKREE